MLYTYGGGWGSWVGYIYSNTNFLIVLVFREFGLIGFQTRVAGMSSRNFYDF